MTTLDLPRAGDVPEQELLSFARRLLAAGSHPATTTIFTSVDEEGWPHAAWMGSTMSPDAGRVYSLTSPDSAKVRHVRQNGRGEWMWVDAARETVLYLRGPTRVIEDVAEMKRIWALFPDKSRSYFLSFFNSAPGYAVIETEIRHILCARPREGRRAIIEPASLARQTA